MYYKISFFKMLIIDVFKIYQLRSKFNRVATNEFFKKKFSMIEIFKFLNYKSKENRIFYLRCFMIRMYFSKIIKWRPRLEIINIKHFESSSKYLRYLKHRKTLVEIIKIKIKNKKKLLNYIIIIFTKNTI